YMGQKNPYIYWKFNKVIKNSAFTTISSEGFKSFLPKYKYILIHSLNKEVLSNLAPKEKLKDSVAKINISFIGNVRFFDLNKKLLNIFKNDSRFQLSYYGTNATVLKEYAVENNIYNTDFYDSFPVNETAKFLAKTDI